MPFEAAYQSMLKYHNHKDKLAKNLKPGGKSELALRTDFNIFLKKFRKNVSLSKYSHDL